MSLRQLREEQNLTQEELADKADVSQSMIQAIETGRRKGSITTLVSIANAMGIKVDDVLHAIDTTLSTN